MNLETLNRLPADDARDALLACCSSERWAEAMAQRRPFADRGELRRTAEELWWELDEEDWLQAFAAHPRIGEGGGGSGGGRSERWSRGEQAGVRGGAVRRFAEANREYEERFGHLFLICASGRGGDEMLEELEQRLENDPETELRVAAGEQAAITALRLDKLLSEEAT